MATKTTTTTAKGAPSTGGSHRESIFSPEWRRDFCEAEDLGTGLRVLRRAIPLWVPAVGLVTAAVGYYLTFRVRLFLAKWRAAARRRAERKYELLDNLRGVPAGPVGAVEALRDDDGDDDDEDSDDETAVSMRDVDEFRSSLGIRLPRDEDLMGIVERMLMADPIPDGWVLYRTSVGLIRFLNLNTQELHFFPPNKRKEKQYIESELARRNRQAMETKYNFSYEDEQLNNGSFTLTPGGTARGNATPSGTPANNSLAAPSPIDFSADTARDREERQQEAMMDSTFRRLFNYFLEKEQRQIELEVARSRNQGTSAQQQQQQQQQGSSGAGQGGGGASGGGGTGFLSPRSQGGTSLAASPSKSQSYRVVSSSTIHASRTRTDK